MRNHNVTKMQRVENAGLENEGLDKGKLKPRAELCRNVRPNERRNADRFARRRH